MEGPGCTHNALSARPGPTEAHAGGGQGPHIGGVGAAQHQPRVRHCGGRSEAGEDPERLEPTGSLREPGYSKRRSRVGDLGSCRVDSPPASTALRNPSTLGGGSLRNYKSVYTDEAVCAFVLKTPLQK